MTRAKGLLIAAFIAAPAAALAQHAPTDKLCSYPGDPLQLQYPAIVIGDTFDGGRLARHVQCQFAGTTLGGGMLSEGYVYESLPSLPPPVEDANCTGACGTGCSTATCIPNTYWTPWWDNGDGRNCHNQMTQLDCYSHDYCYQHDLCVARFGFSDQECTAAAISVGVWACAGPGYIGCAGAGDYTKTFQQHVITTSCCSNVCPPGGGYTECGDYCLPPPPCTPSCVTRCGQPDGCGGTCPSTDDVCSQCGTTNACGRYCGACPCTGTCYPLCGQINDCGVRCSSADDVCYSCGSTNVCGRYCGDCPPPPPPPPPPPCDDTCYSCGTFTQCGRYCGDCPPPPCDNTCYACGTFTECGFYCGDCDPCAFDPCGANFDQCWWMCGG
jgi:hypothetical protein